MRSALKKFELSLFLSAFYMIRLLSKLVLLSNNKKAIFVSKMPEPLWSYTPMKHVHGLVSHKKWKERKQLLTKIFQKQGEQTRVSSAVSQ